MPPAPAGELVPPSPAAAFVAVDLPPVQPIHHSEVPTVPQWEPVFTGEVAGAALIDVQPPPKHRKAMWLALLGVLALVAAAIVVFFVLHDGDDATGETYSLTAASQGAQKATSVAFEMTVSTGVLGDITATGIIDNEAQLMSMSMDLGAMFGADAPIEIIVDLQGGAAYLNAEFLRALDAPIDDDVEYIRLTGEEFEDMLGGITETAGNNPLGTAVLFENASSIEDLGFDEVNGEKVKHFAVTLDAQQILDDPQLRKQFEQQVGETGVDLDGLLGDELTYDVYVNEDNQLRRFTLVMPAGGIEVSVDMVITAINDTPAIEIPTGDGVVDASEIEGLL